MPPLLEQKEIVEEVKYHFSIVSEMEKVIEQNIIQAERLRQSVLKTAFEGRLMPQNPSDEPAEELLKRIRKEKEKRNVEHKEIGNRRNNELGQMGLSRYVK